MEAVIFSGLQGAGKSSFYLARFFTTHVRINLDMLKTRRRERMLLDACHQVSGTAGEMQVKGARRAATLNIGGSATTSVCFIVERGTTP